jgi:hypothetical protein
MFLRSCCIDGAADREVLMEGVALRLRSLHTVSDYCRGMRESSNTTDLAS